MTHLEVKQLLEGITLLIEHLNPAEGTPCRIFHINYGLGRNLAKLTSAVKDIDAHVNKELKEIEREAYTLGTENFQTGFPLLSDEKKERHAVLVAEYLKEMEGENDFQPYLLDPEKCEALEIDFTWMPLLAKFMK